jgi:hypothetical protein
VRVCACARVRVCVRARGGVRVREAQAHQRSNAVKPTAAVGGRSLGRSCIMHSSRVAFLNVSRAASAYLGLTKSGMTPPVSCSAAVYGGSAKMSALRLPGYAEVPSGVGTSPPAPEAASIGASWLYLVASGHMVRWEMVTW